MNTVPNKTDGNSVRLPHDRLSHLMKMLCSSNARHKPVDGGDGGRCCFACVAGVLVQLDASSANARILCALTSSTSASKLLLLRPRKLPLLDQLSRLYPRTHRSEGRWSVSS